MATLSRLGAVNGGADKQETFLRLFAGEVLSTFQENNKFLDKTIVRTLSQGKSATFPVVGTASAAWHTPGNSVIIDGDGANDIPLAEKEIFIDDCLVSNVLIDDLDALKLHWDHRSEFSSLLGRALAKECDVHVLSAIYSAANATGPTVTGGPTTAKIVDADAETSPTSLIDSIFDAAQQLDENDVPREDRYVALRPSNYYNLMNDTGTASNLVNRDYTRDGNGNIADGFVLRVAGFTIVPTNNMETTDRSASGDAGAKNTPWAADKGYNADWSDVVALCFHRSCAGTVKMADLQVLSEYQVDRLAWLLLARYAMGHNALRPECAVAIETA